MGELQVKQKQMTDSESIWDDKLWLRLQSSHLSPFPFPFLVALSSSLYPSVPFHSIPSLVFYYLILSSHFPFPVSNRNQEMKEEN
jgi:hypothetical protein